MRCPYCSSENIKEAYHFTEGWHDNLRLECDSHWHVISEGKNIGRAVPINIEIDWDEDWFAEEFLFEA